MTFDLRVGEGGRGCVWAVILGFNIDLIINFHMVGNHYTRPRPKGRPHRDLNTQPENIQPPPPFMHGGKYFLISGSYYYNL